MIGVSQPAYSRLGVEERRRQLLAMGTELFTRHSYDELSMADIARHAGISKGLMYHYFPSKQDYFVATLQQAAAELAAVIEPSGAGSPLEQLTASVDAWLTWIDGNSEAYAKLMQSATSVGEVSELIEGIREATAQRILAGLSPEADPPPAMRSAVKGWLWFMDGALLDWVAHRDLERSALRDQLLGTLLGALAAAAGPDAGHAPAPG